MEKRNFIIPPSKRAEAGLKLLYLSDDILGTVNTALEPYDISESRLSLLLLFVSDKDNRKLLKPSEIADKLGIKRASVTKQLNWLEENGYISRVTRFEDQRMIDVAITKKGYNLLTRAMPVYWETCSKISDKLSIEETDMFLSLLKKIKG